GYDVDVFPQRRRDHLDDDGSGRARVTGQIGHAHATSSEDAFDGVSRRGDGAWLLYEGVHADVVLHRTSSESKRERRMGVLSWWFGCGTDQFFARRDGARAA